MAKAYLALGMISFLLLVVTIARIVIDDVDGLIGTAIALPIPIVLFGVLYARHSTKD